MKCFLFRGEKVLYIRDHVTNLVSSIYEMLLGTLTNMLLFFFFFFKFYVFIQRKKNKRFLIEQQPRKIC